ncbi:cytochrome P450 2J2-like [Diadema setosum]|uniref:cytochrome P450 2J2-like n=1 Tax=Diadema setosum TaxID=31175 RepID=UPI003B3B6CF6
MFSDQVIDMSAMPLNLIQYVGVVNLVTAMTICLAIFWFLRSNRKSYSNLPPGPPAIPYPLDSLMTLFPSKNRFGRLVMITRRYGDLASIRVGKRLLMLIGSPSLVKDLIVKQAEVTSGRSIPPYFSTTMAYKGGIIFSEGKPWQEIRRFSLSALRNFGMGKRGIEERIVEETRMLREAVAELAGEPFNAVALLNAAVSNIICAITFGRRFDYGDPVFQDLISRIRILTTGAARNNVILRNLALIFPFLLNTRLCSAAVKNMRGIQSFINKELSEHRSTFDPADIRDVIDTYLAEMHREKSADENVYLNDDQLWACVFDLFLAGTETTSSSLLWFLLFMAGKPDIQQRVIEEIDRVIGRERAPRTSDRQDMPFTDATLLEVFRCRPVLPTGVPHVNDKPIQIRGYTIPSETELLINILAIHHDPTLWDDPEEFNPEHFLSNDGKTLVKNEALTVFGGGRRVCLGEQLARMEFFLFATSLLQRFKFRMPDDTPADYSYDHCVGALVPNPFKLIAQVR